MSKNRLKNLQPKIETRAQMEALVHEITIAKLNEQKLTTLMDQQIAIVRQRYEGSLGDIKCFLEERVEMARAWAENHPSEFGEKKSIEFLSGTVGFRTGTPKLAPLNRSWTWEKILDAVKTTMPSFIRWRTPEIDKKTILRLGNELEELLPLVGLKVTQDESFFVEPNISEVQTREVAS